MFRRSHESGVPGCSAYMTRMADGADEGRRRVHEAAQRVVQGLINGRPLRGRMPDLIPRLGRRGLPPSAKATTCTNIADKNSVFVQVPSSFSRAGSMGTLLRSAKAPRENMKNFLVASLLLATASGCGGGAAPKAATPVAAPVSSPLPPPAPVPPPTAPITLRGTFSGSYGTGRNINGVVLTDGSLYGILHLRRQCASCRRTDSRIRCFVQLVVFTTRPKHPGL